MDEDFNVRCQENLQAVYDGIMQALKAAMDKKDANGQALYSDVCEWMSCSFPTPGHRASWKDKLVALENQCCAVLELTETPHFERDFPSVELEQQCFDRRPHALWQLGFSETRHVKGAPPLHGVCANLQKFVCGFGNETGKYPIEILYEWEGNQTHRPAGDDQQTEGIEPFTLAVSTGSSVTLASYLFCWGVIENNALDSLVSQSDAAGKALAKRLLQCLRALDALYIFSLFTHL
eukprot:s1605_g8.t1